VIAVAKGEELWVKGDGQANIIDLVESQINTDPRRGTTEDAPLNALAPQHGAEIILELERQGFTAYSVPAKGQQVLIQRNGNVAFDITDEVHPSVAAMARLAAWAVGLDVAGVDMVLEDAAKPLGTQRAAVIEVNASPGLLAHIKPASGQPRAIGKAIVEHLFGAEQSARIDLVGITGQKDTTLIARLLAWMLQTQGRQVGLACCDGLYLGQRLVDERDSSGWDAGQNLLINRELDVAVFEHHPTAILNEGLAYDKCAVGVVTDVSGFEAFSAHHIDSLDKLYSVVRTQVDVILPHGTAVLNAADPQVVEMAGLCDGNVIYYGLNAQVLALAAHRAAGQAVVFFEAGKLVLVQGDARVDWIALEALLANDIETHAWVLAAVAAAWALGMSPSLIGAGLRTFEQNTKNHR